MGDWFIVLAILFYMLFVMYAANQAEAGLWPASSVRMLLYSLVVVQFLIGPFSIQAIILTLQPGNDDLRAFLDPIQTAAVGLFALACATFTYNLIRVEELRFWLTRFVRAYDPVSTVHLSAVVLVLLVVTLSTFQFVLGGGAAGVAESLEQASDIPFSSLFETTLLVVSAFLGVGFAIRRGLPDALQRLGLRAPTREDAIWGILTGLILYGLSVAFTVIWQQLTDPQTFAQQTKAAQQLSSQLQSIPVVLTVSGGAALGEEIFMRGALQPVFGVWLTSVFFALLHSQYLLTPTIVFIFAVGVAFGRLRWRISTTAAIIAHFIYNVTPFVLLIMSGGIT